MAPNKVEIDAQVATIKAKILRATRKRKEPMEIDEEANDLSDNKETNED